jgi:hypothetical protein
MMKWYQTKPGRLAGYLSELLYDHGTDINKALGDMTLRPSHFNFESDHKALLECRDFLEALAHQEVAAAARKIREEYKWAFDALAKEEKKS